MRALGVVANSTARVWPFMEIVAAGSSRGHAKVSSDMKIKIKDKAIQVPPDLMR